MHYSDPLMNCVYFTPPWHLILPLLLWECCPTLDFVYVFSIMFTFNTVLHVISPFDINSSVSDSVCRKSHTHFVKNMYCLA
jgi:hypothetical protein